MCTEKISSNWKYTFIVSFFMEYIFTWYISQLNIQLKSNVKLKNLLLHLQVQLLKT